MCPFQENSNLEISNRRLSRNRINSCHDLAMNHNMSATHRKSYDCEQEHSEWEYILRFLSG